LRVFARRTTWAQDGGCAYRKIERNDGAHIGVWRGDHGYRGTMRGVVDAQPAEQAMHSVGLTRGRREHGTRRALKSGNAASFAIKLDTAIRSHPPAHHRTGLRVTEFDFAPLFCMNFWENRILP
jgi:hypothetical protein